MSKFKSGLCYIDFEFSRIMHENVNLVCCSAIDSSGKVKEFWLHNNDIAKGDLIKYLSKYKTLVGYSCIAEARSLISAGLEPLNWQWIDLFLEYRCLTNHNDILSYGDQLVDGKVKPVKKPKPKWERVAGEVSDGFKPTHSLAEATFKLLGIIRDTEHKNKMRDLIISDPDEFTPEERKSIQSYCTEDIKDLAPMLEKMIENYILLEPEIQADPKGMDILFEQMITRGRFAAHTAWMETKGYPIDVEKTKNFSNQVGNILFDCQREINELFPEIKPFQWNKKENRFSWKQDITKNWIRANHDVKDWMKTDKKDLSLSLEAWQRFYDFKHDYPTNIFGAQIVRFLKLKQSLYGFVVSEKKGKKNFWDSVGPDNRVRPYTNIYGAQSSRSQPSSTGFMFLKPAWMRALVQPAPGKFMAGIDYGSEEFLIAALLSEDENMFNSYMSGDVYLAFAKLAGIVPESATKESHKFERDICKNTVLGISFRMTKYGLAIKLSLDSGRTWTEEEAQGMIDKFYEAYPQLEEYQDATISNYEIDKVITLPCGWKLFGDNENSRSASNAPVQGCLHGDSRVMAKDRGYQKISSLSGSHRIQVWDGKKFISADCVPAGLKKKTIVKFTNGSEIVCSPEHKFLCVDNVGTEKWKTPKEFIKGQRIRKSEEVSDFDCDMEIYAPASRAANGKNIGLEDFSGNKFELGILLGRLASDGWVSCGRGIIFIVAEHEKNILPYLVGLASKFGITPKVREILRDNKKPLYAISMYSHRLEYQLAETIKLKKSLSHPYLWHSKEMMRGFLSGYMDGDGGISGGSAKITFGKGSEKANNAELINKMFHVFGIKSRISKYSYRSDVVIRERNLLDFSKKIKFININKIKKMNKILEGKKDEFFELGNVSIVKEVTHTEELIEMYDIANCPDHRFMTEGIVTHNTGGSVMRKAVDLAVERGLYVCFTLHDALYIEDDIGNEYKIGILRDCMREAFIHYFNGDDIRERASHIKLDPFAWSPDYEEDMVLEMPDGWQVPASNLYIDSRSKKDYDAFSKYFVKQDWDLL